MFKTRFESWLPSSACDRRTAQAVSTAARRALSPRLLPRDPARLRAALGRRPGRRRVAKHAHRLEAQAEPLATVARADVEGGQLAHALEPVADGVPVGEQALSRPRDAPVRVEIGLEREQERRLVLLVVVGERGDRLRVETLELAGILAHRGEQEAIGPRLLEGERGLA